ncbi:MAG: hypothetical protein ABGY71_13025 [bacterium]|jgi:hypothetical protein|nr:hypothetical protein [Planctomycetota bacterium]HIL52362.1 hypothetical protein [Planctomycetota bacterium]
MGTRAWILILALVCFLAGLAAGLAGAEFHAERAPARSAFGAYELGLVERFDLDPERQRLLVGLVDHYNLEIEEIRNRHTAEFQREMEPELRRIGLEYRTLLRDRLLPPAKRAEFDRLTADFQDIF